MTAVSTRESGSKPVEAPLLGAAFWRRSRGLISWFWLSLVLLFIYAPILVVASASVDPGEYIMNRAFLQFPPKGFTLHWYFNISPSMWLTILNSLMLAACVSAGSIVLGVPAALGIMRGSFAGRNFISSLFRFPLQIPFIVVGVAFLQGSYVVAAATGINLTSNLTGLFLAHLLVGIPYVVGATGSTLAQLSPRYDEAALTLGATRWRVARRGAFPLSRPGVFGGALFAFLGSFTDVTIALFLTPQGYETFPVRVFNSIQNDLESSLPAAATIVFFISAAAILILQRIAGMETVLRSSGNKK